MAGYSNRDSQDKNIPYRAFTVSSAYVLCVSTCTILFVLLRKWFLSETERQSALLDKVLVINKIDIGRR